MSANSAVEIVRYAEQMNDQNTCTGENRDWTNPSKCLVDKALEQWSVTRTRADNTSVVIIMIDPPGPPKREVLKSSTQQFIVENDQDVDAENDIQAPTVMPALDKRNFTMFDHSTKETVDLNTAMPAEGLSIMTGYDELLPSEQPLYTTTNEEESGEDDTEMPTEYTYASSSNNTDISYLTFAESYHQHATAATIETSGIDSAYYHQHPHPISDHQQGILHHDAIDEPYSLTRLVTRNEHYQSTYDESTSTSLTFTDMQQQQELIQQQHMYGDQHQYDSISSSFLSQSCGLMQNPLDDSVQAALLIACEESVVQEETVAVVENIREEDTINEEPMAEYLELYPDPDEIFHYSENDFDEVIPPAKEEVEECIPYIDEKPLVQSIKCPETLLTTACGDQPVEETPLKDSIIIDTDDETIQIHEISSSSKENEDNACTKCSPPQLRSTKANTQRMTRSKQQMSLPRPINALKISHNSKQSSRKQRNAVIKVIASTSKLIQNENVATLNVTRVSSRRICQRSSAVNDETSTFGQEDLSKRTLRSKNLMTTKPKTAASTSTADVSRTALPVVTTTIGNTRNSGIVGGRYRSAKQRGVVTTSILMASRQLRGIRDKPIDLVVAHKPKSMAKGILGGVRKVTTSCAKAPTVTTLSRSVTTRNRFRR